MKLAAVPYLNALPLIYHLPERPRLAPPAELDHLLGSGEIDLATAPIVTLFANPHYGLVPGIAIGTKGAVQSVRLVIKKEGMQLPDIRSIHLDIESRTSVLLLKVLLKFKYRLELGRIRFSPPSQDADAALLIGDKALDKIPLNPPFSKGELVKSPPLQKGGEGGFDLGHEWCTWTGLPFVFAAWISSKPLIDPKWISVLQETKKRGLENLDAIVESEFIKNYLRQNISYDLGPKEIEGIKRFHSYLRELQVVSTDLRLNFY